MLDLDPAIRQYDYVTWLSNDERSWAEIWATGSFWVFLGEESAALRYMGFLSFTLSVMLGSASVFKIEWKCFGFYDPENIFLDNENTQFSGWPTRYFGL